MTAHGSLAGCRAKVERAKEHRDALEVHTREIFSNSKGPRFAARYEPGTGEYVLFVNRMPPEMPAALERTSVILGDAIANLRAALDYLVFQLAIWHTNDRLQDEGSIQFPIVDTHEAFLKFSKRRLSEVHLEHTAIIEGYQPYRGWDQSVTIENLVRPPIEMLRELSNRDKHRLLNTVIVPPNSLGLGIEALPLIMAAGFQGGMFPLKTRQHVELNAVLLRAKLPPGLNVDAITGHVGGAISIDDGPPVVGLLDMIIRLITKIVGEFESVFC